MMGDSMMEKTIDWGHEILRWKELVSTAQIEQADFVRTLLEAGASRQEVQRNLAIRPSRMAALLNIIDAKRGGPEAMESVPIVAEAAVEVEDQMFDAAKFERHRKWLHEVPTEQIAKVVVNAVKRVAYWFRRRKIYVPKTFRNRLEDAMFGVMTKCRLQTKTTQMWSEKKAREGKNAQRKGA
jgi:hypothetical protein